MLLGGALQRCKRAAELSGGSIVIGMSGGKDSLATAEVIAQSGAFSRVEFVSMELVPGLELFRAPVLRAAARYGVPVHFVPHWDTARLIKNAVLRPHVHGADKITLLRLKDIELAITKRTGIEWFASGERSADSIVRRIYTRKCDGVQTEWHRLWPIWSWRKAEVLRYLSLRRIPIPEKIGERLTSGVSLEPKVLAHIKREHPADFRKILAVFPWAEVQLFRLKRGDFEKRPTTKSDVDPDR
jgi:3'-phosphoadenosine 5'-phosphosulfate sulfotransferase (PAPS reductase)/FAD synthetase